jgi:hypothetical protein
MFGEFLNSDFYTLAICMFKLVPVKKSESIPADMYRKKVNKYTYAVYLTFLVQLGLNYWIM